MLTHCCLSLMMFQGIPNERLLPEKCTSTDIQSLGSSEHYSDPVSWIIFLTTVKAFKTKSVINKSHRLFCLNTGRGEVAVDKWQNKVKKKNVHFFIDTFLQ